MKRSLIAVVLVLVAATGLSFVATQRWAQHCQMQATANLHDADWLKHELHLTDAQSEQVAKLETEFRKQMEGYCAKHCSARFDLSQSLDQSDKAAAFVEKMCAAQAESEKATLAHILRVRAILDAGQQQKYAALINQQLCTACPMGMHQP